MPQLPRKAPRLLRRVEHRAYATDDHHEPDPEPPKKARKLSREEIDINASPRSSSDEEDSKNDQPVWGSSAGNTALSSATSIGLENGKAAEAKSRNRPGKRERPARSLTGHGNNSTDSIKSGTMPLNGAADRSSSPPLFPDRENARRSKNKTSYSKVVNRDYGSNFHIPAPEKSGKTKRQGKQHGFQQPRGLNGGSKTAEPTSGFKMPGAIEVAPDTSSRRSFVSPRSLPPGKSHDAQNSRAQKRSSSRRIAEPEEAAMPISSAGHASSDLELPEVRAVPEKFKIRELLVDEYGDPMVHSSQLDADKVEFDENDLEDTQIMSSDEAEGVACPYCRVRISDPDLIDTLQSKKRMSIAEQAKFCRSHRCLEAQHLWTERGYPSIEWSQLPGRVAQSYPHVEAVIKQTQPSVFRRRLEEKVSSGRHRALVQSLNSDSSALDALTPGYYGGRGAKLITEKLMTDFAKLIREQAGGDRIMGATGVSGFVQAVLVPEVACRLMMEDMEITEERAVKVMEESAELGDLLFDGEDNDLGG